MDEQTVHVFAKNSQEEVHFRLREFQGRALCDIRIFYLDDAGNWQPTKKGICMAVEKLGELERGVAALKTAL